MMQMAKIEKQRKIVQENSTPSLFSHVKLHYDATRAAYAILSPEKIFWPNPIALAILNLCNGQNTVAGIIAQCAKDYDAPIENVHEDVFDFLQEWLDQLLVKI